MEVHIFRMNPNVSETTFDPAWDGPQTLVLAFFASEFGMQPAPLERLRAAFSRSYMLGCSSAGEILGSSLEDHSIAVAVLRFAFTRLSIAYTDIASGPAVSGQAGESLGLALAVPDLKGVFLLSEGLNVNGSALVNGMNAALPAHVKVMGALAGDGECFQKTYVLMASPGEPLRILSQGAVAVGFRGEAIRITCGSGGGWSSFGLERRVTRSKGNVVFELDGQPALELYKTYLGDRARNLPASALLFPLAILDKSGNDNDVLVRTVLATNDKDQSLTFAGDILEGSTVQLMLYNHNRLVEGAMDAAKKLGKIAKGPALSLAVSCVGRRMVLGERTEEELEAVLGALPEGTLQVGLYSYGELSPLSAGRCQLQNQTMTLAMIQEDLDALHPMLLRQLKKLDLRQDAAPDAEAWVKFLERVNRFYHEGEQDRYTLERALGLSSDEMQDLASQLQLALEQVRHLSLTDDLTGLRNRRFLNATIPDSVAQVIRQYRSTLKQSHEQRSQANIDIVFLMVDLDSFKIVNDTYGHLAGDRVLIQMRQVLVECSRSTDFVVRWGGEEFLIVARDACRADQMILAERVRKAVDSYPFDVGREQPIHLTCSIGATVFPFLSEWPEVFSWDRVVELADICLYAAKRSGRNAWIGIRPTSLSTPNDLSSQLDQYLPDLIREGRLDLVTSLPHKDLVQWPDFIYCANTFDQEEIDSDLEDMSAEES